MYDGVPHMTVFFSESLGTPSGSCHARSYSIDPFVY